MRSISEEQKASRLQNGGEAPHHACLAATQSTVGLKIFQYIVTVNTALLCFASDISARGIGHIGRQQEAADGWLVVNTRTSTTKVFRTPVAEFRPGYWIQGSGTNFYMIG